MLHLWTPGWPSFRLQDNCGLMRPEPDHIVVWLAPRLTNHYNIDINAWPRKSLWSGSGSLRPPDLLMLRPASLSLEIDLSFTAQTLSSFYFYFSEVSCIAIAPLKKRCCCAPLLIDGCEVQCRLTLEDNSRSMRDCTGQ